MKKIVKQLLIVYVGIYSILLTLYNFGLIDYGFLSSSFYAGVLSITNLILALLFYHLSLKKSNKIFIIFNLGGMGVRLFLLLIAVFIFLKFLKIDEYGFIFIFFILYILQLIIELGFFNRKADRNIAG